MNKQLKTILSSKLNYAPVAIAVTLLLTWGGFCLSSSSSHAEFEADIAGCKEWNQRQDKLYDDHMEAFGRYATRMDSKQDKSLEALSRLTAMLELHMALTPSTLALDEGECYENKNTYWYLDSCLPDDWPDRPAPATGLWDWPEAE